LLGQHDALLKQKIEWDHIQTTQIPQLRSKVSHYKDQAVELSGKVCELESKISTQNTEIAQLKVLIFRLFTLKYTITLFYYSGPIA